MPFPSTLDSTAQDKVRGYHYDGDQFMLLGSNTVIFAARINGAPTGNTYAQVTFDTVTVGAYTDIVPDMTVYLSKTNSIKKAYFRGRARFDEPANKVASATILYIDETSDVISDNDYIFVVEDYALHAKFGKATTTTYKKDFNRPYAPPFPVVTDLQSAYGGVADPDTDLFVQAFSAGGFAVAFGATITDHQYTIPASGVEVVDGDLDTTDVTLSFEPSEKEYWIHHSVTDSNGKITTMHIPVWSIPSDLSTTIAVGFEGASIDGALDNGFTAKVDAFEGVDGILDQTLAVLFEVEYHDGEAGSIVTPIKLVGRFRRDTSGNTSDETASRILNASFEIEGMAAQLVRTNIEHIKAIIAASPSVWDQIAKLTPWRAICHFLSAGTTFFNINSLKFDSTSNDYIYPSFPANGQSVMDAIKDVLSLTNSGMEWAQSGEARIGVDLRYDTPTNRNAADVVMDFTIDDTLDTSLEYQHVEEVALINAAGGTYSTANGQELVVEAKWPGITAGKGSRVEPFNRNVLAANLSKSAAQTVLKKITGYHAEVLNTRFKLTVQFPDQYNWLVPSVRQWYRWSISVEDQDSLRHDFDTSTRWLCISVSIQHDNSTASKPTVEAVFVNESASTDAQEYDPPASGATTPANPTVPGGNVYPNWPDIPIVLPPDSNPEDMPPYTGPTTPQSPAPMDGSVQIAVTHDSVSHGWVTREGLINGSRYIPLDPPLANGERIYDAKMAKLGLLDAYFLASDGIKSHVYYTDNVLKNVQDWQISADITGLFTKLRTTDTAGKIYIEGITTSGSNPAEAWSIYTGTETSRTATTITADAVFGGGSWRIGISATGAVLHPADSLCRTLELSRTPSSLIGYWLCGSDIETTAIYSGQCIWNMDYVDTGSFSCTFTLAIDPMCGEDDVTGTKTALSVNFGATFAAPVTAGTGVDGGIDTEKIGDPVLIGSVGQVLIATTSGGAYSDYGDPLPDGALPTAIFVSRLEFGSTTVQNIETIDPQFLLGSSTATDDDETLWKVETGGTDFISITPTSGGDPGTIPDHTCIDIPWRSGKIILGIFDFGGTRKLGRSLDSGGSWSLSSALDDAARCLVTIVNDKNNRQLWFANGADGIGYIKNYQSSLVVVPKLLPTPDPVICVDVYL